MDLLSLSLSLVSRRHCRLLTRKASSHGAGLDVLRVTQVLDVLRVTELALDLLRVTEPVLDLLRVTEPVID